MICPSKVRKAIGHKHTEMGEFKQENLEIRLVIDR